jgi:hypothetical protein
MQRNGADASSPQAALQRGTPKKAIPKATIAERPLGHAVQT